MNDIIAGERRHDLGLTADLRVEFLRPSRPGRLVASGTVIRRTRQVVFCAADLHDSDGVLLASSRCTRAVLPAGGTAGRSGATTPVTS